MHPSGGGAGGGVSSDATMCDCFPSSPPTLPLFSSIDSLPVERTGDGAGPLSQQQGPSGQAVRLSNVNAMQPACAVHASWHCTQLVGAASLPTLSPAMSVSGYNNPGVIGGGGGDGGGGGGRGAGQAASHAANEPKGAPPPLSTTHCASPGTPLAAQRKLLLLAEASWTLMSAVPITASAPPKSARERVRCSRSRANE